MTQITAPKKTRKHSGPSRLCADLLRRADQYGKLANRKRSSVSLYIMNDGKSLDAIASGSDLLTRQYERADAELTRLMAALAQAPAAGARAAAMQVKPAPRKSLRPAKAKAAGQAIKTKR